MSKNSIITCRIRNSCYNKKERIDRMKRFVIILGLLLLSIPLQTKAILCSNEKKAQYQTLASNIKTSYTYTEANGTITFQVILSNIPEGFIIKDIKNGRTYSYQGNELVISNLQANTSYRFDIYTSDILCDDDTLYSHYVNLPPYNPYYQDAVCIGMESHALCQKWTQMTLSYEEFKQKVENSKITEEKPVPETPKEEVKGIYDYVLEFYLNYYYIILPIFIIGGIVIIYRYNKKNDLF